MRVNIDKDGIAWLDTTPAYVSEKMGTEQEILRPADIIEKQVEMMKSKEGTGEMKLSEVSLEFCRFTIKKRNCTICVRYGHVIIRRSSPTWAK